MWTFIVAGNVIVLTAAAAFCYLWVAGGRPRCPKPLDTNPRNVPQADERP